MSDTGASVTFRQIMVLSSPKSVPLPLVFLSLGSSAPCLLLLPWCYVFGLNLCSSLTVVGIWVCHFWSGEGYSDTLKWLDWIRMLIPSHYNLAFVTRDKWLTSLRLCFLICKMDKITIPFLRSVVDFYTFVSPLLTVKAQ